MDYYTDNQGIERPDRRRRNRLVDDYRIESMFQGLDNIILNAKENGDLYLMGYTQAMRTMLAGLVAEKL
jgi:hypothetical protein